MNKEVKKNNTKFQKVIFYVSVTLVIILSVLLMVSKTFGDFTNVKLRKNKETIFSISDLKINDLKFGDDENKVTSYLGKPKKVEKSKNNMYEYKILYYDGLTITLKENYNDYILSKVEITSKKYKISRNIKVGKGILRVMKKFKVENSYGTYIYGKYTIDSLNNLDIKDIIYMGIRSSSEVVYIYKDASSDDTLANIARLNISYKNGRVSKIIWSYDIN